MLLALLASFAPQLPVARTQIQAHVSRTPWVATLQLQGWKDMADGDPLRKELGEKLVLSGTMEPAGAILTLIAEPNGALISPAAWRKRHAIAGAEFECQLSACVDATLKPTGAPEFADFHAFTCAAGFCFDLHVSRVSPDGKEALARAEFERIVKSLRVLLLRRGWAEYYPDEIGDQMTLAALAGPGRKGWKEAYLPKHAGDWQVHFVEAEFLRQEKAPLEQQIASYQKALELAAKLEKPGPKQQFAWAMACDGLGLALHDAQRLPDSIAPLEKGYALLAGINRPERAALAYNLACAQALSGHEQPALAALANAIVADARYRESAAKDADFATLRNSPEYQKLVAKPAPSPIK
jgi:hypothetical protein